MLDLLLPTAVALLLAYACYVVYRPLRYERPLPAVNAHRKVGSVPPPYPNSWFRLCWTFDVSAGPAEIKAFGRLIRAGRSGSTQSLHAVDACCAAQQSTPPFSCALHSPHAYPVEEALGAVLIWRSSESTSAPAWRLPSTLLDLRNAPLVYHGHTQHKVACHCQELPENGPDSAHLNFLHRPFMFAFPPFAEHQWENVSWRPGDAAEPHLAHIKLTQRTEWLGFRVPLSRVSVDIFQIGIGVVLIKYYMPPMLPAWLGGRTSLFWMLEFVTPEEPMLQRVCHIGWGEPLIPRPVAKLVLAGSIAQFERDIPIWSKKTFVAAPLAVRGDGPLPQFRRWAQQFYTKSAAAASEG